MTSSSVQARVVKELARNERRGRLGVAWERHLEEALIAAEKRGTRIGIDGAESSSRFAAWLRSRVVLGTEVEAAQREGLPSLRRPLKDLTPLEILGYWHPRPQVRLVANRLARKLDLNITEVCNYDCFYCYQRSRDDDWEEKATKASQRELTVSEWVEVVREAALLGVKRVKITGGEPLTKPGAAKLIESCLAEQSIEEVELCTNGSLLERHIDRLASSIRPTPDRFHIHTSIDGISDGPRTRELTKASRRHLDMLEQLIAGPLAGVKVSVNTMWNQGLTDPAQLRQLHAFMVRCQIERWTISYPYFVRDFIASSVAEPQAMPDYAEVVDAAATLVQLHERCGRPFHLSIPLIVKHELVDRGYSVSSGEGSDHPCFPCHGSYFVIGPEGDVFDCLLLSRSRSRIREHESLWGAGLAAAVDNPFYHLTTAETARDCGGCRYADLCHGQCASDRANTHPALDGKSFSRDRSACSLLPLAESRIWSHASPAVQRAIAERLDPDGFVPARWASPHAIATFAPPVVPDQWLEDCDLDLIDEALVRKVSPHRSERGESAFGAQERLPKPRRRTAQAVFHQSLPSRWK